MDAPRWEPPKWLTAILVGLLGVGSAFVLGADLRAAYPSGDGGLFYAIIHHIGAANYSYPRTIHYNGFDIPFAYSPLGFYGIAALVKLTSLPIGSAMNLWVITWDVLMAPAGYLAARRFLGTRLEAIAATAVMIVFPGNLAWLGMGGAVTRAPGLVFFVLASGLTWEAFTTRRASAIAYAAVAGAFTAWFHMEFAFLYAATFVLLAIFARPPARAALMLATLALVLASPWPALAHASLGAFVPALHTSHEPGSPLATLFVSYFGVRRGALMALVGLVCGIAAAALGRQYLWLLWITMLLVLDSRAGPQAAHLPSALAVAWCFGHGLRATARQALDVAAASCALVMLVVGAAMTGYHDAQAVGRLRPEDATEIARLGTRTEPNAWIIPIVSDPDQSYEWVPALTDKRSPVVFQGLEWVRQGLYLGSIAAFREVEYTCVERGAPCLREYVRRNLPRSEPVYIHVAARGTRFRTLLQQLRADPHFTEVLRGPPGATFKVLR